jgi:hypothetical protein
MFSKSNNILFLIVLIAIISYLFLIKSCNYFDSKFQLNVDLPKQDDLLEIKFKSFDSLLNYYSKKKNLTILKDSNNLEFIVYRILHFDNTSFQNFTNKKTFLYKNYIKEDTIKINAVPINSLSPDTLRLSIKVYNKNNELCCKIPADIVFSICKNSIK